MAPPSPLCPRCAIPLFLGRVASGGLLGCGRCGGVFADASMTRRVTERCEREALPLARAADASARVAVDTAAPVGDCPTCRGPLRRSVIAAIEVDACDAHGTWFDAGELVRLADAMKRAAEARPAGPPPGYAGVTLAAGAPALARAAGPSPARASGEGRPEAPSNKTGAGKPEAPSNKTDERKVDHPSNKTAKRKAAHASSRAGDVFDAVGAASEAVGVVFELLSIFDLASRAAPPASPRSGEVAGGRTRAVGGRQRARDFRDLATLPLARRGGREHMDGSRASSQRRGRKQRNSSDGDDPEGSQRQETRPQGDEANEAPHLSTNRRHYSRRLCEALDRRQLVEPLLTNL